MIRVTAELYLLVAFCCWDILFPLHSPMGRLWFAGLFVFFVTAKEMVKEKEK